MSRPEQYDISTEEYRKVQDRARIRAQMRKEFFKLYQNPHRINSGHGYGFDPQMQRFMSMKVSQWEFFKPNFKTFIYPFVVICIGLGYGHLMQKNWQKHERLRRTGQVSSRDRQLRMMG